MSVPDTAPRQRRRELIAAAAVLAVLLGLAVTNVVLARAAEQRAADRAAEAVGAPVDVRFSGWPVGFRLLAGRPLDVHLSGRDLPIPDTDAVLDYFEVELDRVPLSFGLLREPDPELHAERGTFVAELGDDAVQQLVGLVGRIPLVDIELRGGVARLNFAGFPVVDATGEIDQGQVVFRPTAPIATFARIELRLEELPFGLRGEEVAIRPGLLRLTGDASRVRLGQR